MGISCRLSLKGPLPFRPLGFQNFVENLEFAAVVLKVNGDGTIGVKYDDEDRQDPRLPCAMATLPVKEDEHESGEEDARQIQKDALTTFFEWHFPVHSKTLRSTAVALLDSGTGYDTICESILEKLGSDPRAKKKKAGSKQPRQGLLPMSQVQKMICTEEFECVLSTQSEIFRRSVSGRLGSATKGSVWEKLRFGDDDADGDIVGVDVAANGKLIVFVGSSGKIWFAGITPGGDGDEGSWVAAPELLVLPPKGGAAKAVKKEAEGAGDFGQAGFGGGGFGGGGFGFGRAPQLFGGGFGAPAGLFGAPPAFGGQPPQAKKDSQVQEKTVEFKKVQSDAVLVGYRLASVLEVRDNMASALPHLDEWDIAELSDGKLQGTGYTGAASVVEDSQDDVMCKLLVKEDTVATEDSADVEDTDLQLEVKAARGAPLSLSP